MKLVNNIAVFMILITGACMAYGIYTDNTNAILSFGFLLNAIVTIVGASKK